MSYCRWSSDDFGCDLYIYETAEGFTIHVAACRYVFAQLLPPPVELSDPPTVEELERYLLRHCDVVGMLDADTMQPIGLSNDGASFYLATANECANLVDQLATEGYRVPDGTAQAIRDDAGVPT